MRKVITGSIVIVITAAMLQAQSPQPALATSEAFDVVSVKLNKSPVNSYGGFVANGFEAVAATTQQLISLACVVDLTQRRPSRLPVTGGAARL